MTEDSASSQPYSSAQSQDSGERYRALFLQEQGRARHLSLINEVQKCALAAREGATFLQQVCRAIQSHFSECDVSIYLCDRPFGLSPAGVVLYPNNAAQNEKIILVACAGEHGFAGHEGDTRSPDSLAGRAIESRRTQYLNAGQREYSVSEERPQHELQSGMCVPITSGARSLGAICMESARENAVEGRDAVALQTAAGIIASHLEANRFSEEMRELSAFNQTLINWLMHSLMAVNRDGQITLVNERLCQNVTASREELLSQPIERVFAFAG